MAVNNYAPVVTVEDLFRKYVPERGIPLSQDVIYWANKFGPTIEQPEENEFRSAMLQKYGIDIGADGGAGNAPSTSTGPGQGISSTAQSIGLGLMGVPAFGVVGLAANAIGNAVAAQQADAIANSFAAMAAAAPAAEMGIATVSDEDGNISTVSTPATVAAADEATFGVADTAPAADDSSDDAGDDAGDDASSDDGSAGTSAGAAGDGDGDGDGGDGGGDGSSGERRGGLIRRFAEGGVAKFDADEIAGVAERALKNLTSLDTPKDMTAAETAADIAAGFVPGLGTAQGARDFERARREGDKLGMTLAGASMVPVVGGVVKPAKAAARSVAELAEKYLAPAVKEAPKEQKMLMGVYRGYAGNPAEEAALFATPQKRVADYYAQKRAAQTGGEPHVERLLVDPFAGRQYGHSIPIDKFNREVTVTRARKLKPEDVQGRTQLYAAGGPVKYDPAEIDTIVSRMKEEMYG